MHRAKFSSEQQSENVICFQSLLVTELQLENQSSRFGRSLKDVVLNAFTITRLLRETIEPFIAAYKFKMFFSLNVSSQIVIDLGSYFSNSSLSPKSSDKPPTKLSVP